MTRHATLAALAASALLLTACGSGAAGTAGSAADHPTSDEKVDVVVGFYPLEYLTRRIGGDRVTVSNLTKPGAEPHDVELTPQDVAVVSKAELAVYERALQPAVAEAVTSQNVKNTLEVGDSAQLNGVVDQPIVDVSSPEADHDHAEAGSVDPHFWLDPVKYLQVAKAIQARLEAVDPGGAATYRAGEAALEKDLTALDAEYRAGLKDCTNTTLVTSHAAFGYLAKRYGFEQAAISGLSPEEEPEPRRLAQVADYARKNHVTAIYAETLSSPAVAEAVARETGATQLMLDPIEGLSKDGTDYLSVMRSNLATLKTGQGCS